MKGICRLTLLGGFFVSSLAISFLFFNNSASEELVIDYLKLEHADFTEIRKQNEETIFSWQGNVRFRADDQTLKCDQAEWFSVRKNIILVGNVFCEWDNLTVEADYAEYSRNSGLLRLQRNIRLIDNEEEFVLSAGCLEYSRRSGMAIATIEPVLTIANLSTEENGKVVISGRIMTVDAEEETYSACDSATIMMTDLIAEADTLHYYSRTESAMLIGEVEIVQNRTKVVSDQAMIQMTLRVPEMICAVGGARSTDQINETFMNSLYGDSLWLWSGEERPDSIRSRGNARGIYYPENDSGFVTGEIVDVAGKQILIRFKDEKAEDLTVHGMATGSYRFQKRD